MKESTEQLKQILAGKPDGAVMFDGLVYFKSDPRTVKRSLTDIAEIVALREDNEKWKSQALLNRDEIERLADNHRIGFENEVARLREEVERLRQCVEPTVESFNLNEIRAQAVEDFMDWINSNFKRGRDIWSMAEEYANSLRNQKEGE